MTYLGWEWAFYLFGLVGVLWFAAWQYIVSTRPQDHPRISAAELDFIQSNARFSEAAENQATPPIREFLKSKAVWAILVAHFCNNWTLYVILSWLPKVRERGSRRALWRYWLHRHAAAYHVISVSKRCGATSPIA